MSEDRNSAGAGFAEKRPKVVRYKEETTTFFSSFVCRVF
jgi:hypothetical protein